MDPATLVSVLGGTIDAAKSLLTESVRKSLAREARAIAQSESDSRDRIRSLFLSMKDRLSYTWKVGMIMTITLFVLFVVMALIAITAGVLLEKPVYSIIFGGVSASSLLSVIIWKPYDLTFRATVTIQRLEVILVGLEEEWALCERIEDAAVRATRIRAAHQAALRELARLSP